MPARRLAAVVLALALAGCLGQAPFEPAPVRFGRVDFLEARGAGEPSAPLDLRLDRDALAPGVVSAEPGSIVAKPDDALLAIVRFEPSLVGRKYPARLVVTRDRAAVASLDIPDIRNARLDVHVQLRRAPAGRYVLRVEARGLAAEKAFEVQP